MDQGYWYCPHLITIHTTGHARSDILYIESHNVALVLTRFLKTFHYVQQYEQKCLAPVQDYYSTMPRFRRCFRDIQRVLNVNCKCALLRVSRLRINKI